MYDTAVSSQKPFHNNSNLYSALQLYLGSEVIVFNIVSLCFGTLHIN